MYRSTISPVFGHFFRLACPLMTLGGILFFISALTGWSQNTNTNTGQGVAPVVSFKPKPALRGDTATLRPDTDPNDKRVTTLITPNSTAAPADQPIQLQQPKPKIQTDPDAVDANITPTAKTDSLSLFRAQPSLRLSEASDLISAPGLDNNSLVGSRANSGNGRLYEPGFKLGVFDVLPGVSSSFLYDDNISTAPNDSPLKRGDFIYTISPSITLNYAQDGDVDVGSLNFTYIPSPQIFTSHTGENSVSHNFSAQATYKFTKLNLGFTQSLSSFRDGDPDSGERVQRLIYDSSIFAEYSLGEKTSVELTTRLGSRQLDSANSFNTYNPNGTFYVNYDYTPKLKLGAGLSGSLTFVQSQPAQSSLGPTVRAIYDYSEKTKFFLEFGLSVNQYGDDVSESIGANFSGGAQYELSPLTSLTLSTRRAQSVSNTSSGQDTITTGVSVGVSQKLPNKFTLSLSTGYENSEYIATLPGVASDRSDDYIFFTPSLSYPLMEFWDLSLFYSHRENASSAPSSGFQDNQVSLQTAVRF